MKKELFGNRATGKLVPIANVAGATHAFIPNPLPPNWTWPADLWPLLLKAHTAMARLDGIGKHLPDAEIILTPLQNREAQRSSSLEGTVTDPVQQALFQLDPRASPDTDGADAYREVFNYSQALKLRQATMDKLPLSLRLIRRLHGVLMADVRGADKNPGEFRKHQNQIGRPPRYVPPPPHLLNEPLDALEKYLHSEWDVDPLVAAFLAHYQFEAIHPFMDGNGRVGRVLLAICIAEWCGLSNQWLYMSAYYDRFKDEYINRLLRVSTAGEWKEWIAFCLRGVIAQADDTQRRCDLLIAANKRFQKTVAGLRGGSVRLSSIVDQLFTSPVTTVTAVQQRYRVTYPTARSDLLKLERAKIVEMLPHTPQITYYCRRIIKIIHSDDASSVDGQ